MTTLTIEPGIVVQAPNPRWNRKFEVAERIEKGIYRYFRCKWIEPDPDPSPHKEFSFWGFGVVHVHGTDVTETWVISSWNGKILDIDIETRGRNEIARHWCHFCNSYVNFSEKSEPLESELVKVTYTCPSCHHQDVDMID